MESVDRLRCDGCDRSITSMDGPGMLAALKGPCPDCGGRFDLNGKVRAEAVSQTDMPPLKGLPSLADREQLTVAETVRAVDT